MKTKLTYLRTGAKDIVVSINIENECRYLTETNEFPYLNDADSLYEKMQKAIKFLNSIEDISSWDDDVPYEKLFGGDETYVIAQIEKDM